MSTDQQENQRVTFAKGFDANMMAIDGTWRRACILKDVSQSGARLIMEDTIQGLNLKEFFLVLSSSGLAYRRCELAWVNGDEIGVNFLAVGRNRTKRRRGQADEVV
jgi:hypothetical protein